LLLAADFRFYDYTATLQTLGIRSRDKDIMFLSFALPGLSEIFGLDVHAFHVGGKYAVNEYTNLSLGFTITSNGITDGRLFPATIDTGNSIAGGISRRIKSQWISVNGALVTGRERPAESRYSNYNFRGHGLLFSLGWRLRK
jgi:hypothetical protein